MSIEQCEKPYLFQSDTRCCICGGKIAACPGTPQDAMDHYAMNHNRDCEPHGHEDIAEMMMAGLPNPQRPCRHCGEAPAFQTESLEPLRLGYS